MYRVVLGDKAEEWIEAEPPGPRLEAVEAWLAGLVSPDPVVIVMLHFPGEDLSTALKISNTNLAATCIFVEAMNVIVVEKIDQVP